MKDACHFLNAQLQGGGNLNPGHSIVVRRSAAMGDAIAASTVAEKLAAQGFPVIYQVHPSLQSTLRLCPHLTDVLSPAGFCHVNLDGAYENDPGRRERHFADLFFAKANTDLDRLSMSIGPPVNAKPCLIFPKEKEQNIYEFYRRFPKPWIVICPRSNYYLVRQIPDLTWAAAAQSFCGTAFWLGNHRFAPPGRIVDGSVSDWDRVTGLIACASLLVSVDTGPLHIAAALGVPAVAISQSSAPCLHLNDQNDFSEIAPPLNCLNCQKNVCPLDPAIPPCTRLDPDLIAAAVNARALAIGQGKVSALIPTYNADAYRLNRCLDAVLPQVEEVVVSVAADGKIPEGVRSHAKLKIVRARLGNLGFGKNANFGFRHTKHDWVLLLNDDVFLEPDVVAKLLCATGPSVGGVSHLLRYPGGDIQYGGKYRDPGAQGWFHASYRKWESELKTLTEQEVLCGASVLLRRQAFYDAGGFDERFFMYAEDDDLSMRLRQAGWKLFFTPAACGIHEESMSCRSNNQKFGWIFEGNILMRQLWKSYWDANKNCAIGTFGYENLAGHRVGARVP